MPETLRKQPLPRKKRGRKGGKEDLRTIPGAGEGEEENQITRRGRCFKKKGGTSTYVPDKKKKGGNDSRPCGERRSADHDEINERRSRNRGRGGGVSMASREGKGLGHLLSLEGRRKERPGRSRWMKKIRYAPLLQKMFGENLLREEKKKNLRTRRGEEGKGNPGHKVAQGPPLISPEKRKKKTTSHRGGNGRARLRRTPSREKGKERKHFPPISQKGGEKRRRVQGRSIGFLPDSAPLKIDRKGGPERNELKKKSLCLVGKGSACPPEEDLL